MTGVAPGATNVFVERLWRSVKYERVYLQGLRQRQRRARPDIADYMNWYNAARAHSRLADLTPDEHYFAQLPPIRWPHKMSSLVRPELPTASVGSSQAPTAAVDNSAPSATRPQSTYRSGKLFRQAEPLLEA